MDANIRFPRRPDAAPPRTRLPNVVRSVLLLVAIVLAGCAAPAASISIPPDATGSTIPATTGTPPPQSPSAAPSASFPLALTDDEGTSVSIPAAPQRIVSLTPATTEILFALGVGDRIVGKVDDPDLFPPAAAKVPNVAKFGSVDVEKIVALQADLVIAGGNTFTPPESVAKLRSLHIPTVVVYAPTVDKVFADVLLTGEVVGRPAEAAALATSLRADFAQVTAATASLPKPRVFYEIDATGAIYGPADKSFLAEMIQAAGGQPITTGSANKFDIPIERLIQANPEVILLGDAAYGVTPAQVATRPGWKVMAAVKSTTIRPINDVVVTRPGPRIGQGLRALAMAIHPDLVLPSAAP